MPSELLAVTDAVVSALNGTTHSLPFTAERRYRPEFELAEMKDLHVTAVPRGTVISTEARGKASYDYKVDVAVQKRIEQETPEEIDPLMRLVEEIADLFRFKRLEGYSHAIWVKTEYAPVYSPEHLGELRQFTGVMTFTFRVVR